MLYCKSSSGRCNSRRWSNSIASPDALQHMEEALTIDSVDKTVITTTPVDTASGAAQQTARVESRTTTATPEKSESARRIVTFAFGLIQVVIGLRFVLLLLDAREANGLVSGILSVSQIFVAPFEGILRTDALHSAGSTFDVTAVVAIAGWTILELIVMWAIGIFRRPQTA